MTSGLIDESELTLGRISIENKLLIDVVVSIMSDAVTSMLLNRRSNFPSVRFTHRSCVEIPGALFVHAFDGISPGIYFDWVEFIDIEESSTDASVFES